MKNSCSSRIALFALLALAVTPTRADWLVVENPVTSNPEAVWSDPKSGGVSDVQYSYLDGASWSAPATLSAIGLDGSGPVLAFDGEGARRTVWGTSESPERVLLRSLPASGGTWSAALAVSDSSERSGYPSAIVFEGDTFVGYEVITGGGSRTVKVARCDPGSNVERSLVRATASTGSVVVEIHAEQGHLWTDWIDSESYVGYSVWSEGSWGSVSYEAIEDLSEVKTARELIREEVLGTN